MDPPNLDLAENLKSTNAGLDFGFDSSLLVGPSFQECPHPGALPYTLKSGGDYRGLDSRLTAKWVQIMRTVAAA